VNSLINFSDAKLYQKLISSSLYIIALLVIVYTAVSCQWRQYSRCPSTAVSTVISKQSYFFKIRFLYLWL